MDVYNLSTWGGGAEAGRLLQILGYKSKKTRVEPKERFCFNANK